MNNNNFLIHKINLISTFYCIIIFFSNHGKYMQTYYNTTQKNNASYHNEDHVQILLWTQTYTCILFYFVWFFFWGGVHIGSGTLVLHFIKIAVVPTCMRYTGSGQGPAQTIALIWSPILCLSYNRKDEKYFKMTFSSIRMYAPPTGTWP